MLCRSGPFLEHVAYFERPIPALLATRLFAPRARRPLDQVARSRWQRYTTKRAIGGSLIRQLPRNGQAEREQIGTRPGAQPFTGNYPGPAEEDGAAAPTDDLFEPEGFESVEPDANIPRSLPRPVPRYSADSGSLFEDEIITPISKSRQRRLKRRAAQRTALHEEDASSVAPVVRRTEEQPSFPLNPRSLKAWALVLQQQNSSSGAAVNAGTEVPASSEIAAWVEDLDLENVPQRAAKKYWARFGYEERAKRWPCLMVHYLDRSPDQALQFIRHIITSYEPPTQHVAEVLGRVANALDNGIQTGAPSEARETRSSLWDTLQTTVDAMSKRPHLTQKTIHAALNGLEAQKLYSAMDWLAFKGYYVSTSVLHLISRSMAARGNMHDALTFFREIVHTSGHHEDTSIETTAIRIVLCAVGDSGEYANGLHAAESIQTTMPSLARPICRVLLIKAIGAGNVQGAWDLFYKMVGLAAVPDDEIYSMMMNMSRKTRDRWGYKELYRRLNPETRQYLDASLVAEIMQCRHAFNARANFDHVLRFYERHCNLRPLKVLGIVAPTYISRFVHFYPQPRPGPKPLSLSVILHKFMTAQYAAQPVIRVYLRFLHALRHYDPEIMALAAHEQVWQGFLKAFGNENAFTSAPRRRRLGHRGWPIHWRKVLDTMATWTMNVPGSKVGDSASRLPGGPSRVTWNIVINAHARKGKLALVRDVLRTMKEQGLRPDIVTWNSLLSGFARFQNVYLVATILWRMRLSNIPFDGETTKALALVYDREGLMQAMNIIGQGTDHDLVDSVGYQSFEDLKARVMELRKGLGGEGGRQHWQRAAQLYHSRRTRHVELKTKRKRSVFRWKSLPLSRNEAASLED